MLIQELKN